ncbi:hypothetical protein A3A84_02100 [Candidatus Collierbacteria bacterium RIFCSPLOWO2_01_FULL_50_23]|uniref:Uncharacterized protein n=1 Tax=Candidatus Collierbacteria bacterium RIFCSPHIGHO2_01_FULL_50_25 TaxID=1817722 RepID=A0A1F5EVP4_9BACT|nr:MAG: hypothetical protein A2703_02535 [Candidatus Collierbacteria bacterium RIFCSPHIGHO2_01_FULL_50_25]OGD73754.1 MAG: hypothetical protein A3A84_02100 [Candidatus Collierbacteria bacterium RIFCSPLOWO2_01_FULL_50_23]
MSQTFAVYGSTMRVEILVGEMPQPIYRRKDDDMPFVEALLGRPYVIRVTPTFVNGRLEVISSVDGRNTLKNEVANPIENHGMVISSPWEITGFRLNQVETAQFVFGGTAGSVVEQATGSTVNAGVIGLASYREFQQFNQREGPINYGLTRSKGGEGADAGTHAGEARFDPVGTTTFRRATLRPVEMLEIQYRTRDWLVRNGIIASDDPSPWPGFRSNNTGYDILRK